MNGPRIEYACGCPCPEGASGNAQVDELFAENQKLRAVLDAARAVIESTYDKPSDGPEVRQPPSQESLDKLEAVVIDRN